MDCPGCNTPEMAALTGGDETVHACRQCGSVLIEVSDLTSLLLHHNLPGVGSLGGRVDPEATVATCPACQIDFTCIEGRGRSDPPRYQSCENCGNVFLDDAQLDAEADFDTAKKAVLAFFKDFASRKG